MKETLQAFRDKLLEKVPQKNYSPAEKAAMTKRVATAACIVGAVLVLLLVIVLFPITNVEIVSNQSHYTEAQLTDALEIGAWTPVTALLPRRAEQRLLDKLLYLDAAEVDYVLPGTLRITVHEQQPLYYFYYDTQISGKNTTGWLAVGPDLRVVDAARSEEVFASLGMTRLALPDPVLDQTKPGRQSTLCFTREDDTGENAKTEQDFAYIAEFLSWLEQSDVADRLTSVDLTEKFDVKITLQSQYRIELGRVRDQQDFAQKMALAQQILAESKLDPDAKYIVSVGVEQPYLRPAGDVELDVSGQ